MSAYVKMEKVKTGEGQGIDAFDALDQYGSSMAGIGSAVTAFSGGADLGIGALSGGIIKGITSGLNFFFDYGSPDTYEMVPVELPPPARIDINANPFNNYFEPEGPSLSSQYGLEDIQGF